MNKPKTEKEILVNAIWTALERINSLQAQLLGREGYADSYTDRAVSQIKSDLESLGIPTQRVKVEKVEILCQCQQLNRKDFFCPVHSKDKKFRFV